MIQGHRFPYSNRKELSSHEKVDLQHQRTQLKIRGLYGAFQKKYSWYFIFALVAPFLIFTGPSYYFLMENYQIFQKLAYDFSPELIEHLNREIQILSSFFIISILLSTGACFWLTRRLTKNIIGPVISIEKHIKKMSSGDWSDLDYKYQGTNEFQSLAASYSYLFRSLKVNTEKEILSLEKIKANLSQYSQLDKNTEILIHNMIMTKKSQLGLPTHDLNKSIEFNFDAPKISSFPEKRHAS